MSYEYFGFTDVHISAGNGRSITKSRYPDKQSGLQAVSYWKNKTGPGRCWVIALGTNDAASVRKEKQQERIGQMVTAIGPEPAVWVNVSMHSTTRRSYNRSRANEWNSLLVDEKVIVLDWDSIATNNKQWFAVDGIHYTPMGGEKRAFIIAHGVKNIFSSRLTEQNNNDNTTGEK